MAVAHPTGFHKKITVTVTDTKLSALLVMDVDSGQRCVLLREAADSNRDGVISGEEVKELKARLVKLVTKPLLVSISSSPVVLTVVDTKLSLRDDRRANDSPLSVAVLAEFTYAKHALGEGMELEIEDIAPDQSTIAVQVFQAGAKEPPFEQEVKSGVKTKIRLGKLERDGAWLK